MKRKVLGVWGCGVLFASMGLGQGQQAYLDVFIAKVKPEKRAEFDAVCKKIAEANRRFKGDNFLASDTVYGEGNTVSFVSPRGSYGDIEKASDVFGGAIKKAYGQAGADKLFQDLNNTLASSRSEVRRRRWDLTGNPPADAAAEAQTVGQARWVHTITVHVRPGQDLKFEALLKEINGAARSSDQPPPKTLTLGPWISEMDTGGSGAVFYITWLMKSMGEMDEGRPLSQILGEEGYHKFLDAIAESAEGSESFISHFLPELSNPPEQVVAAAPDFWRPKATVAARVKPKAPEAAKVAAKGSQ
jgi:hypothetical protein